MARRRIKISHRPGRELIVNGVPLRISRRATVTFPETIDGTPVKVELRKRIDQKGAGSQ